MEDAFLKPKPLRDRVRELLAERGISQAVLAELTKISPSGLSRLLSGKRKFQPHHVEVIARTLEMAPAELVVGTDGEDLVCAMASHVPRELFENVERELAAMRAEVAVARSDAEASRGVLKAHEESARTLALEVEGARNARDVAARELAEAREQVGVLTAELRVLAGCLATVEAERNAAQAAARASGGRATALEQNAATNRAAHGTEVLRTFALALQVDALSKRLAAAEQQSQANYDAYLQAHGQLMQARSELKKTNPAAAALLGGLLGLGLAAAASR